MGPIVVLITPVYTSEGLLSFWLRLSRAGSFVCFVVTSYFYYKRTGTPRSWRYLLHSEMEYSR